MKKIEMVELDEQFLLCEISEIQVFSYLNEEEKKEILSCCEILSYDVKEKIITEGETTPYLYAVLQGNVHVIKRHKDGDVHVSTIGRGNVFGEAAMFIKMKRTADVIAGENVQVLQLERRNFLKFLKMHPETGIRVLMIMVYGLMHKLKEAHEDAGFDVNNLINRKEVENILDDYK